MISPHSQTILIVEDNISLLEALGKVLRNNGFHVLEARDGNSALRQARARQPHLILLDLGLPDMDGIEVCKAIRSDVTTGNVRIMMLTARDDESDLIIGFAVGADDYVTKPFSMAVLLHRVRAILRRRNTEPTNSNHVSRFREIMVDRRKRVATVEGQELRGLTSAEFSLLDALLTRAGRVLSREELVRIAFGRVKTAPERSIDVRICHLRRKLGNQGKLIKTVRGSGYCIRADEA
jgi:two-component system phosphate regulon response regulator PhoB